MENNNNKTSDIKEIGSIDISRLHKKIDQLALDDWDTDEEYEVNYNKKKKTEGDATLKALHFTKHIIFRFTNKQKEPFQYIDCSRWEDWNSILIPIMDKATEYLGYKNRYYPKVMLANLPAKNFIPPHIDGNAAGYIPHKFHIPIQTNEQAFFHLEEQKHHFKEGYAYEVNNGKRHAVINNGNTDRIHLIFECLDFDLQSDVIQASINNRLRR